MRKKLKLDLSFWRVLLVIYIAKGFSLWQKDNDVYLFHLGWLVSKETGAKALKLVFLCISINLAFLKRKPTEDKS